MGIGFQPSAVSPGHSPRASDSKNSMPKRNCLVRCGGYSGHTASTRWVTWMLCDLGQ